MLRPYNYGGLFMANEKLPFIRTLLKPLGLSDEAIDKVIDFISDLLFEKDETSTKIEYPYHQVDEFISHAELNFFFNLKSVVGDSAHIFSKVKLSDLFYAKTGDYGKNRSYTNKIDRKHVDFLLCDPKTLKPILGIELDDKSHQRTDRQERDDFVNHVFEAAKLPLMHVSVQRSYSQSELKSKVSAYLSGNQIRNEQPTQEKEASPRCPKCGSEMVVKTAKQGERKGKNFWACPKYPNCEGAIINIDT
jgi:ssDNA-binding Zn-finger/Zn-ribbon topoisomerase 1